MKPTATIRLSGGPLDGLEIAWPENVEEFPTAIDFRFMGPRERIADVSELPRHTYVTNYGYSHGPVDSRTGFHLHEVNEYLYEEQK